MSAPEIASCTCGAYPIPMYAPPDETENRQGCLKCKEDGWIYVPLSECLCPARPEEGRGEGRYLEERLFFDGSKRSRGYLQAAVREID